MRVLIWEKLSIILVKHLRRIFGRKETSQQHTFQPQVVESKQENEWNRRSVRGGGVNLKRTTTHEKNIENSTRQKTDTDLQDLWDSHRR